MRLTHLVLGSFLGCDLAGSRGDVDGDRRCSTFQELPSGKCQDLPDSKLPGQSRGSYFPLGQLDLVAAWRFGVFFIILWLVHFPSAGSGQIPIAGASKRTRLHVGFRF